MYTITKQFHFSAAHALTHLPPDHKCHTLHGHNYIVEVVLQSPTLDDRWFVVDYGDLAPLQRHIDAELDHKNLNEVLGSGAATTAERLAHHLYDYCFPFEWFGEVVAVRVSETPKTWAEYRPDNVEDRRIGRILSRMLNEGGKPSVR